MSNQWKSLITYHTATDSRSNSHRKLNDVWTRAIRTHLHECSQPNNGKCLSVSEWNSRKKAVRYRQFTYTVLLDHCPTEHKKKKKQRKQSQREKKCVLDYWSLIALYTNHAHAPNEQSVNCSIFGQLDIAPIWRSIKIQIDHFTVVQCSARERIQKKNCKKVE